MLPNPYRKNGIKHNQAKHDFVLDCSAWNDQPVQPFPDCATVNPQTILRKPPIYRQAIKVQVVQNTLKKPPIEDHGGYDYTEEDEKEPPKDYWNDRKEIVPGKRKAARRVSSENSRKKKIRFSTTTVGEEQPGGKTPTPKKSVRDVAEKVAETASFKATLKKCVNDQLNDEYGVVKKIARKITMSDIMKELVKTEVQTFLASQRFRNYMESTLAVMASQHHYNSSHRAGPY
jgi:hypothetical protein